jgi:hypothetical protein
MKLNSMTQKSGEFCGGFDKMNSKSVKQGGNIAGPISPKETYIISRF